MGYSIYLILTPEEQAKVSRFISLPTVAALIDGPDGMLCSGPHVEAEFIDYMNEKHEKDGTPICGCDYSTHGADAWTWCIWLARKLGKAEVCYDGDSMESLAFMDGRPPWRHAYTGYTKRRKGSYSQDDPEFWGEIIDRLKTLFTALDAEWEKFNV